MPRLCFQTHLDWWRRGEAPSQCWLVWAGNAHRSHAWWPCGSKVSRLYSGEWEAYSFSKGYCSKGATRWTDWYVSLNLVCGNFTVKFNIEKSSTFRWICCLWRSPSIFRLDSGSRSFSLGCPVSCWTQAHTHKLWIWFSTHCQLHIKELHIFPFCPKKGSFTFLCQTCGLLAPDSLSASGPKMFQGQNPKFPATSISLNVNYRAARHRDRFLGDPLGLVFCRGPSGMERNNGTAAIRLQHIIPWCYTNGFVNTWEGPIVIPGSMPVPVRSEQSADSKVDSCCIGRETWHTRQLKKKHLNHEMFFDRGVLAIGQLVYLPLLLLLDDYGWCWMDYSVHCQDPCGQTKPSLAQGFLRPLL